MLTIKLSTGFFNTSGNQTVKLNNNLIYEHIMQYPID